MDGHKLYLVVTPIATVPEAVSLLSLTHTLVAGIQLLIKKILLFIIPVSIPPEAV